MLKRFISLMLALMLAFSICACQSGTKQAGTAANNPGTAAAPYISGSSDEDLSLYDEKEIGVNSELKFPGGSRMNSRNQLVVLDNGDGRDVRFVTLDADGKAVSEVKSTLPGMIQAFDLDSQDHIFAVISEPGEESQTIQKIVEIGATGEIINTYEAGKFKLDGTIGKVPIIMEIALDTSGHIYLATLNGGIKVLDKNGKETGKIGNDSYYSIDTIPDGKITALHFAAGKQEIVMLDPATGDSIWSADLSKNVSGGARTSASVEAMKLRYDSSNQSICYMDDQGVTRYDLTGKLIGDVLIFNRYMILSSGNEPSSLSIDQKGNFYIITRSREKFEILRYDIEAGAKKVKGRKTLTVAIPTEARWLEIAASKFQKENPDYRIDIKNYGQADQMNTNGDNENYIKTLNTELLTGKGPDLLSVNRLPFEKYINRNILADLDGYMAKDGSFDEAGYFANILDALKYKGKLYILPVSVSFDVLAANKELLEQYSIKADDTLWSWEDLNRVGEKLTGNRNGRKANCTLFPDMSSGILLENLLKGSYNRFVDTYNKKAGFNTKEFTDLLEMAKVYGYNQQFDNVTITGGNYIDPDSIIKGTVLFNMQTFTDYTGYAFLNALYKGRLELMSYPSAAGEKKAGFNSDSIFAINKNSKGKEAAWEFLKFLLSDEIQSDELSGFPISKAALKVAAQRAVEITNSGGMSYAIGSKGGGKPQIFIPKKLTQQDIDYIDGFIMNLNTYNYNNPEVKKIILDEAGSFFAGNKSAEDAAGIIQQKAAIYLGE